jgi:hypothetical protein
MMMENLFLMILYLAFIGAIKISTTIALYSIILGFNSANYAGCTHVHVNNNV